MSQFNYLTFPDETSVREPFIPSNMTPFGTAPLTWHFGSLQSGAVPNVETFSHQNYVAAFMTRQAHAPYKHTPYESLVVRASEPLTSDLCLGDIGNTTATRPGSNHGRRGFDNSLAGMPVGVSYSRKDMVARVPADSYQVDDISTRDRRSCQLRTGFDVMAKLSIIKTIISQGPIPSVTACFEYHNDLRLHDHLLQLDITHLGYRRIIGARNKVFTKGMHESNDALSRAYSPANSSPYLMLQACHPSSTTHGGFKA
ncbi:uncharacterized protein CLUP02_09450 [Colletotrichum lupini]|uniref:Uncharacterized protein n=1 Tax=Colletotrichum lupini TaxID=145971 RepID=A0A9Q8SUQ7_9PEZI|nr:uncharacterized protein CLUP02_09450 [Colletotrichum lupini]UQC83954.1 hypothetical protein CLUP02_09450 [Colletotrichum lupini]